MNTDYILKEQDRQLLHIRNPFSSMNETQERMCPLEGFGIPVIKVRGLALYNVTLSLQGSNYLLERQSFTSFSVTVITLNYFNIFEEN